MHRENNLEIPKEIVDSTKENFHKAQLHASFLPQISYDFIHTKGIQMIFIGFNLLFQKRDM